MKKPKGIYKAFEVTSVCKADILGLERWSEKKQDVVPKFKKTDIMKLTEDDMRQIASKMADAYTENVFWIDLEIIVENHLSKKKEYEINKSK